MKKVFGSFVLWHVSGILKYGVHVWLAWVSLAKLVIFSVSALTIWRPDFLAEFAQLLKVAELSSPLPARKLWPSALQWFHRGSLAFFCFAHLPCELHQPMSTISILQMNETHNDIVFLSWRWIGPRCFSCMFFSEKRDHFEHHVGKTKPPTSTVFSYGVPTCIFRVFRVRWKMLGSQIQSWNPWCFPPMPVEKWWRLIRRGFRSPKRPLESWWSLAFWAAGKPFQAILQQWRRKTINI